MHKSYFQKFRAHWPAASILFIGTVLASADAYPSRLDVQAISEAAGVEANVTDNGVVRIGWSRDEVPVTIDGIAFPPAAGLGSWASFKALTDGGVMMMGDTVVFEDEITPAMDAAFAHGLRVTALHNHFIFERPPVYFMHISGTAKTGAELAQGVAAVWEAIQSVREADPIPDDRFNERLPDKTGKLDVAALKAVLGTEPSVNKGVVKFSLGRQSSLHGTEFGASMGVSTWAAFAGNADYAVVDGDFAMTAGEVQPVMHALRRAGIHIVALHNHMIGEEPKYYFLHYWGKGKPQALARGIRAALETQR